MAAEFTFENSYLILHTCKIALLSLILPPICSIFRVSILVYSSIFYLEASPLTVVYGIPSIKGILISLL